MKNFTHYNLDWLLKEMQTDETIDYLFFWGHTPSKDGTITKACFSQWWQSPFEVDSIMYATAEHWMMAKKAKLFGDLGMIDKILNANSPFDAKKLGREVKNFDPKIWGENCFDIVCEGNYHKFSQHLPLKQFLLNTGNSVLVEASPRDRIWGIGMGQNNENARNPLMWRGKNLLNFALMAVRDKLRDELVIENK